MEPLRLAHKGSMTASLSELQFAVWLPFLILFPFVSGLSTHGFAQSSRPPDAGAPAPLVSASPVSVSPVSVSPVTDESAQGADSSESAARKGKRSGRQAEGSQAPNKFEADPVMKSRYQMHGRPLEVDPD
jgi:hypothetical protein